MVRILSFVFVFWVFVFGVSGVVLAADLDVSCSDTDCSPASATSIFPNDDWFPGRTVSRTIKVTNTGSGSLSISTRGQNAISNGDLDNVMNLTITRLSDSVVVWGGTLNNFYSTNNIGLTNLGFGQNDNFVYTVSMESGSGNEYQNKKTSFDLVLGFSGGIDSGGSSGGGSSSSSAPSAPTCNDQVPGSAPVLVSAIGGINSVTLTWTKALDPVSYYLVAYGSYGNPNVGGKETTSYTVNGLSGGTTYYFRVRAGNGCMPGPFSNELAARPIGSVLAEPAEGFTQGVLGTTEDLSKGISTEAGEIKGESKIACVSCIFWPAIILEIILGIILLFLTKKLIVFFGVPILGYIVFIFLNRACLGFCRDFWIWTIVVTLTAIVLSVVLARRKARVYNES